MQSVLNGPEYFIGSDEVHFAINGIGTGDVGSKDRFFRHDEVLGYQFIEVLDADVGSLDELWHELVNLVVELGLVVVPGHLSRDIVDKLVLVRLLCFGQSVFVGSHDATPKAQTDTLLFEEP